MTTMHSAALPLAHNDIHSILILCLLDSCRCPEMQSVTRCLGFPGWGHRTACVVGQRSVVSSSDVALQPVRMLDPLLGFDDAALTFETSSIE